MLHIIAKVDRVSQVVLEQEKPLPILLALLRGTRRLGRVVFEDDLRLSQVPAESLACAKQDQRGVRHLPVPEQFCVGEQLLGREML
ncbi:MAG: hypothetical protein ACRERE_10090 [Candidatus Entotheonellia bacterium]